MTTWSDGYVTDIQYTTGFYRELAPNWLALCLISAGQRPPALMEGYTFLELGCGQGLTSNLLAAANPGGRFYAVDFNPAQIANARTLAAAAGLGNITFVEASFEELAADPEAVPPCDAIVLHGIYSWVTAENRRAIVDIIRSRLKPGGMVYVSYNCQPGWAAMAPFQRLMREYARVFPGRSDVQAQQGIAYAKALDEAGALYFKAYAPVPRRLEQLGKYQSAYIAHEYLNASWTLLFFPDVADEMAAAKLDYAASASLVENLPTLSIPKGVLDRLAGIHDLKFVQLVRDLAVNQQFRRDLFVRGANGLSAQESAHRVQGMRFALVQPASKLTLKFQTPLGEGQGDPDTYQPLAEALSQGAKSVAELRQVSALAQRTVGAIWQACLMLCHSGQAAPALAPSPAAIKSARAFNQTVVQRSLGGQDTPYLAAPVTGSGIACSLIEGLVVDALVGKPNHTAESLTPLLWTRLCAAGKRLVKDGKSIEAEADNLAELRLQVEEILRDKLPLWKSLGIA